MITNSCETKKVAMLQPNYIPWKGVFDMIDQVDIFVFYDDVQYTKRDWRNRNKIKTPSGEQWLTIPVKNAHNQLISEVEIDNQTLWQKKHLKSFVINYSKSPYFNEYKFLLEKLYQHKTWDMLSDFNIYAIKLICEVLNISANWVKASDLNISGNRDGEKVIAICKELGCNYFINGPSAKKFMDEEKFVNAGIKLNYMEYNYPEYKQLYGGFNHYVTILDLIFNCGSNSKLYM